jgi:dipeptidase E
VLVSNLLLLSTTTVYGGGFLEYARPTLKDFLGASRVVHFAPYALLGLDAYTAEVRAALAPLGITVVGIHESGHPRSAIADARVLFVGGGNSFRLLRTFQRLDLLDVVRDRVRSGSLSYWGSSAGSNLACPTIRTTNDMPIVEPSGLRALDLIPFQLNPHYLDADPTSTHMGETRERRLVEFLEENDVPVVGLREGAFLRVQDRALSVGGQAAARLFRRGSQPVEYAPGSDLSPLLASQPRFDHAP